MIFCPGRAQEEFPLLRGLCKTAIAFCRFLVSIVATCKINNIILIRWLEIFIFDFLEGRNSKLKLCRSIIESKDCSRKKIVKNKSFFQRPIYMILMASSVNKSDKRRTRRKKGREVFEDPGYRMRAFVTHNFITRQTKRGRGSGRVTRLINCPNCLFFLSSRLDLMRKMYLTR